MGAKWGPITSPSNDQETVSGWPSPLPYLPWSFSLRTLHLTRTSCVPPPFFCGQPSISSFSAVKYTRRCWWDLRWSPASSLASSKRRRRPAGGYRPWWNCEERRWARGLVSVWRRSRPFGWLICLDIHDCLFRACLISYELFSSI